MAPSAVIPGELSPAYLSFNIVSYERQQEGSDILGLVMHKLSSTAILCKLQQATRFLDLNPKQLPISANEGLVDKSLLSAH